MNNPEQPLPTAEKTLFPTDRENDMLAAGLALEDIIGMSPEVLKKLADAMAFDLSGNFLGC